MTDVIIETINAFRIKHNMDVLDEKDLLILSNLRHEDEHGEMLTDDTIVELVVSMDKNLMEVKDEN